MSLVVLVITGIKNVFECIENRGQKVRVCVCIYIYAAVFADVSLSPQRMALHTLLVRTSWASLAKAARLMQSSAQHR